jgi:single-stranded DNA-binding protein
MASGVHVGSASRSYRPIREEGSKLYIEGKIETRTYEKDGEKRYSTEIKANSFEFLDKKEDSAGSGSFSPPNAKDEDDGLLPF